MKHLLDTAAHIDVQIKDISGSVFDFDTDYNTKRLRLLARMYAFARYHMVRDASELVIACAARQVPSAEAHQNPYLPVVRICAGRQDDDVTKPDIKFLGVQGRPFIQNSSWDKYAGVLRHAHDLGKTPEEFVEWASNFPGRLDGIVKADRARHGKPRAVREVFTPAQKTNALALAKLGPKVSMKTPAEMTGLHLAWVLVENGVVSIGGIIEASHAAALAAASTQHDLSAPLPVASVPAAVVLDDISAHVRAAIAKQNQANANQNESAAAGEIA